MVKHYKDINLNIDIKLMRNQNILDGKQVNIVMSQKSIDLLKVRFRDFPLTLKVVDYMCSLDELYYISVSRSLKPTWSDVLSKCWHQFLYLESLGKINYTPKCHNIYDHYDWWFRRGLTLHKGDTNSTEAVHASLLKSQRNHNTKIRLKVATPIHLIWLLRSVVHYASLRFFFINKVEVISKDGDKTVETSSAGALSLFAAADHDGQADDPDDHISRGEGEAVATDDPNDQDQGEGKTSASSSGAVCLTAAADHEQQQTQGEGEVKKITDHDGRANNPNDQHSKGEGEAKDDPNDQHFQGEGQLEEPVTVLSGQEDTNGNIIKGARGKMIFEVNDMNVLNNAQVKSALQTLNQNGFVLLETQNQSSSDLVTKKRMMKRAKVCETHILEDDQPVAKKLKLSSSNVKLINNNVPPRPRLNKTFCNYEGLVITYDDVRCLLPGSHIPEAKGAYVNENIVDFYIRFLSEHNKVPPHITFVDTTFFSALKRVVNNMESARRWFPKDWRNKSFILIPIINAEHWYGVVICNPLGLGLYGEVGHGDKVLLLHSDLGPAPEQLQSVVESLQARVGAGGKVYVESVERLGMASYPASSFCRVYSGCVGLATVTHDLELLAEVSRLLRPGGTLTIVQAVSHDQDPDTLTWPLLMAELSVTSAPTLMTSYPNMAETLAKLNMSQGKLYTVTACKPSLDGSPLPHKGPYFVVLDSLPGSDRSVQVNLIRNFLNFLCQSSIYTTRNMPQRNPLLQKQDNSYDCAMFLCEYFFQFCQRGWNKDWWRRHDQRSLISPEDVGRKRSELLEILTLLSQSQGLYIQSSQEKSRPEKSVLRSRSILKKGEKRNILCKQVPELKKTKTLHGGAYDPNDQCQGEGEAELFPNDQCPGEGSLHRRQGDNDKSSKVSKIKAKSRDCSIDSDEETAKK